MPTLHKRLQSRRQEGAAAVEFALVSLMLITLLLGIVDFGYAINRDTMLNNAAREGAREGSLNPKTTDIKAVVSAAASGLDGASLTTTVTCRKAGGGSCSIATATSGDVVVVKVDYTHKWITPIGSTFGPSLALSKSAEMRIE